MVIMEDSQISAPESIVNCIREFVVSIRNEWDKLSEPLDEFVNEIVEGIILLDTTEVLAESFAMRLQSSSTFFKLSTDKILV